LLSGLVVVGAGVSAVVVDCVDVEAVLSLWETPKQPLPANALVERKTPTIAKTNALGMITSFAAWTRILG
jgi:hypothetical protein